MQCLYCGKKLSLLRKLADKNFCCDEHREAHRRLQDELALTRLGHTRGGSPAKAPPAPSKGKAKRPVSGIPPFAPLLPQGAVWSDFRRILPFRLQSAPIVCDHFLPDSGLRIKPRGLPVPEAALWQPPIQTRPQPADPHLLPPPPILPAPVARAADTPPPSDGTDAPIQPLLALAASPCTPALELRCSPRPLHRRKLVVIVPESRLAPPAGPALAHGLAWTSCLRPAAPASPQVSASLASLAAPEAIRFPASALWLEPPAWITPEDLDSSSAPLDANQPGQPPLAGLCSFAAPSAPAAGFHNLHWNGLALLPAAFGPSLPALVHQAVTQAVRLPRPGQIPLECNAPASPAPDRALPPASWLASGLHPSPAPRLCLALPGPNSDWPALQPLIEGPGRPGPAQTRPIALPASPLPVPVASPVPPALHRPAPPRVLRPVHRFHPVATPAAAPEPLRPGVPDAAALWCLPTRLPSPRFDLQPPEPALTIACAPEEITDPGLHALGRAVAGPLLPESAAPGAQAEPAIVPAPPEEAEPPAAQFPAEASRKPAPESGAAAEGESEPAAALARRLPMLPVRPVDSLRSPAVSPSAIVSACWDSLGEIRPAHPSIQLHLDHADGSGPRRYPGKRPARPPRARRPNRFWGQAPSDLKWIAVALPLLLMVVVYSFNGKTPNNTSGDTTVTSTAAVAQDTPQPAQPLLKANALQRFIMRRAGIRLFDDFRSGLSAWQGAEEWAKSWRYGEATFVQPGDLALLSSSIGLRDYTLTFLGQIDRRSLNWVFRARNLDNYYSMRIVITRGGPLPEAVLVRSIVLGGKERELKTLPIPFPVQADTLYLVRMEIRGQDFTTYIQDQVVDHFSDHRLASGGIGFFSPRGDRALLRWVEVSHQYDYLGRLCALLSPYGVQALPADQFR